MTYQQFIEALRPLYAEAQNLFDLEQRHETPVFRKWRHQVTDLIERIEEQGYSINSSISTRAFDNFGGYTYTPSPRERMQAYNRDLQDTINELHTLVEGFEKFGDPNASKSDGKVREPLKSPDKMTLSWLWQHAHISLWLWLSGVLITVFMLGVAVGQSTFYAQLQKPWSPSTTVESTTPNKSLHGTVGDAARPSAP